MECILDFFSTFLLPPPLQAGAEANPSKGHHGQ